MDVKSLFTKDNLIRASIFIVTFIIGSLFLYKVLHVPMFLIYTLAISGFIVFILSKFDMPNYIFSGIAILITLINLFLVILAIIPTYSSKVDMKGFYQNQENYIQIQIKDDTNKIKSNLAKLQIVNKNRLDLGKRERFLDTPNIANTKIPIYSGDIIYYISKTKDIESMVNIYLWDGSIIRLLPQSAIKFDKIIKDTQELMSSQTDIQVQKGGFWFKVIRTIKDENSFNMKTSNGTIVIRGTSGFISQDSQTNETTIYSNDHIIELIDNAGISSLMSKAEVFSLKDGNIQKINFNDFFRNIGEQNYNNIKNNIFQNLDNYDVDNYKLKFRDYAQKNFGWAFDGSPFLENVGELKLNLFSTFDKRFQQNIDNYEKYKVLISNNNQVYQNINGGRNINDIIFTPINTSTQNLKMQVLQQSSQSQQDIKNYIINVYNNLIDQGKTIQTDELKNNLDKVKTNGLEMFEQFKQKVKITN